MELNELVVPPKEGDKFVVVWIDGQFINTMKCYIDNGCVYEMEDDGGYSYCDNPTWVNYPDAKFFIAK